MRRREYLPIHIRILLCMHACTSHCLAYTARIIQGFGKMYVACEVSETYEFSKAAQLVFCTFHRERDFFRDSAVGRVVDGQVQAARSVRDQS